MRLLSLLLETNESVKWLEKIIITLIRQQQEWLPIFADDNLTDERLSQFLNNSKEKIWQVYLLIKGYNKQRLTLTQLNKEYALEKLLVDTLIVMNGAED